LAPAGKTRRIVGHLLPTSLEFAKLQHNTEKNKRIWKAVCLGPFPLVVPRHTAFEDQVSWISGGKENTSTAFLIPS
jgi:hypothetical protein